MAESQNDLVLWRDYHIECDVCHYVDTTEAVNVDAAACDFFATGWRRPGTVQRCPICAEQDTLVQTEP